LLCKQLSVYKKGSVPFSHEAQYLFGCIIVDTFDLTRTFFVANCDSDMKESCATLHSFVETLKFEAHLIA
jgi:hypothetical protein